MSGAGGVRTRRWAGAWLTIGTLATASASRGDVLPGKPPACTRAHRGDACASYAREPGVCQPIDCNATSHDWAVAKGETECLACVVPPDPPFPPGSPPPAAPSSSVAPAPPASMPPAKDATVAIATGAAGIVAAGALVALLVRRRRRGS